MNTKLERLLQQWDDGYITRAEIISYLSEFPPEEVEPIDLPEEIKKEAMTSRQALAAGEPVFFIRSHC